VKIGRDTTTGQLVIYKHVGPLYTSNEWKGVNIVSVNNIPNASQPVGARPYVSRTINITGSEVHETLMLERETHIARLVQEPMLKNSVTTKTMTDIPLETGTNVNS
jgi:hypothetical protein